MIMIETLKLFHEPGDVIEIRVIGKVVSSGYFKDADKALKEAMKYDGKANVYFVLNKINEACYHRENKDRIVDKAQSTTDAEIDRRRWILIDFDPVRPAKTSATDEEKAKAEELMQKAGAFLRSKGFKTPILADSGNGWHLLYKIDMPNNDEAKKLIEQFLKVCDMLFSTDEVKIDTVVHNASRITKLYGTMAVKGSNTEERPHRVSRIKYMPKQIEVTPIDKIKLIKTMLPEPPKRTSNQEFDLHDFMNRHGLRVIKETSLGDGTKYVLESCPFDHTHGKDSAIIQLRSGALAFHCFHNGCSCNGWKELRELYEPYIDKKPYEQKEYKQEKKPLVVKPSVSTTVDAKTQEILKKAKDLSNVKSIKRDSVEVLETGVYTLDKRLELVFGKLAVISGTNGSGKSTLVGQWMLESLEQKYNVFSYSGELMDSEFQYWIDLQAAGKDNLTQKVSKAGKEYYDINTDAKAKIHQWYKDRFFLYDNKESMNFKDIIEVVETFRVHRNCRVIFLDNFLTMDISDLDDKELKAQTIFINSLASYCKEKQVLIFLVIHPKKIYKGICTKGDVLGSGNLTNAIDYLFLVHRMNEAFILGMKDRPLSKEIKASMLAGTNVLEVSKDRWTGSEGLNIPLKYYDDSKRLVDTDDLPSAYKSYSWEV